MDFIKKHYEKVILSVVLLAVAVVVFLLTVEVGAVKDELAEQLIQKTVKKGASIAALDLSTQKMVVVRSSQPLKVVLDGPHNTFNPGTWEKAGDAMRRKQGKAGLAGLSILRIIPLNLVITYRGPVGVADNPRYQFAVAREFEKAPAKRQPVITSLNVGTKNNVLSLIEVRGPKEDPTELVCELVETRERFILSRAKDFRKPVGYAADLKGDGRDYLARRVEDILQLGGTTYKIVAIAKDELVVSAPNQVRTRFPVLASQ